MLLTSSTTINSTEKLDLGNTVELSESINSQKFEESQRFDRNKITMFQNSSFPIKQFFLSQSLLCYLKFYCLFFPKGH